MSFESAGRKAVWPWCSFSLKRPLTCLIWILAQIRIIPPEGEDEGEGSRLFLFKLGLWDAVVFLNELLMSVSTTKNQPLL